MAKSIFYKGGLGKSRGPCSFLTPYGPPHTALQNQDQNVKIPAMVFYWSLHVLTKDVLCALIMMNVLANQQLEKPHIRRMHLLTEDDNRTSLLRLFRSC